MKFSGAAVQAKPLFFCMFEAFRHASTQAGDSVSANRVRPPLPIPAPYNNFAPLLEYELSQVDLTHFPSITARIDRLDLLAFPEDLAQPTRGELKKALGSRVTFSNNMRGEKVCKFVVNDPTPADLSYLIQNFYLRRIIRVEFAIDFKLQDGENDLRHLWLLKAQLRHCLAPQGFQRLQNASRKAAKMKGHGKVAGSYKFAPDGLGTPPPLMEVLWENASKSADALGLYVKTHDRGMPIKGQPFVRLELRLRDLGPHLLGLGRLGLFPAFAPSLRTSLRDAFYVGSGFTTAGEHGAQRHLTQWERWGAQWACGKEVHVRPNMEANRRIGLALNDLRKMLIKLSLPTELNTNYSAWVTEMSC